MFVRGWYIYQGTGERVEASLCLYNRPPFEMRSVITYPRDEFGRVQASEVIPRPGDQFQVLDRWAAPGAGGLYEVQYAEGGILTFGKSPVTWMSAYPIPGEYLVQILVVEMEGNLTVKNAPVTILPHQ